MTESKYVRCTHCKTLMYWPSRARVEDQSLATEVALLTIGILRCAHCPRPFPSAWGKEE